MFRRDRCLVAHCLPVAGAANPDPRVAIGTAEILSELMTFHVGTGGDAGGIAVEPHDHVAYVDRVIAKLTALAGRYTVFLGGDLSQRSNGHVVFGESAFRELGIAMK